MDYKSSTRSVTPLKIVLALLVSAILGISYLMYYGLITIQPWWMIGLGVVAAVIGLSYVDGQDFATPLYGVAAIFIVWRVALWLIGGIGIWYSSMVLPFGQAITVDGGLVDRQDFVWETLITSWLGWDGGHYQNIALNGYSFFGEKWPSIAFFPLYPLLIRLFLPLTGGSVGVAALLVSHIALFGALLLLYDLLAHDFNSAVAHRTLVLLLIFPTSLFLAAAYSESIALALAVAALWAIRRQRWWLAGAAGFFLSLTRLPGIMIALLIAVTYLQHHNWRWRAIRSDFLAVLLPPAGLALFMLFQWWKFGTPVAFLIAQENWDQRLSPPWVMPLNLRTWIADAVSPRPMLIFQAIIWISFIGLMVPTLRRLPLSYGLTALLLLLPPYLNNRSQSLPRYVLLAFPTFVVLALLAKRWWVRALLFLVMLPLLVIATLFFVNDFWVA